MKADNFQQIKDLLEFEDEKTFYFIQVMKRRKDNPEMEKGVKIIENYYIYSKEDLEKLKNRIVEDCEKHNARAYIKLNKLDSEKVAKFVAKKVIDLIIAEDFRAVKNAYTKVCGSSSAERDNKKWIVDLDPENMHLKDEVKEIINKLHSIVKKKDFKILDEIPTVNGCHLVTNPFNLHEFRKLMGEKSVHIDIQKNSPTLLYA